MKKLYFFTMLSIMLLAVTGCLLYTSIEAFCELKLGDIQIKSWQEYK